VPNENERDERPAERYDAATGRRETELERLDRNLAELLGELRVALPGVQVLFAFLLVVPFNQRFTEVTPFQEKVYVVTLLASATASALLIAPSVHHRLRFRRREKDFIVRAGNRLAIAGLTALGVAMVGVILLVTDFLFGATTSALATIGVALLFALVWYAIPFGRRQ
jgi:hypothetical protein